MAFDYESIEQQLRLAAKAGNTERVMALLENGAQIDAAPSARTTAFWLAVKYQHLDTARLLRSMGASPWLEDASNIQELRFLRECGVEDRTLEEIEAHRLRVYERFVAKGLVTSCSSRDEHEITVGRPHDRTLTVQTTVSEAETEHPFQPQGLEWELLKARMQPGDELWKFDNGMWDQDEGRRGYVLFRQGRQLMRVVTFTNFLRGRMRSRIG